MKFSFIIPTFNRKELTANLINQIINEQIPDSEILVIDDCSGEGTPKFLLNNFPSVRVLVNDKRRFAAHSRNRGIRESRADTLVFLDSDISFNKGVLKEFITDLKAGCNFPDIKWIDGTEMFKCTTSIFAIQRDLLRGFKGYYFDENIGIYGEDHDFFLRAALLKINYIFNDRCVFIHEKLYDDTNPKKYSSFKYYMCYKNSLYLSLKYFGLLKGFTFSRFIIRLIKNCCLVKLDMFSFKCKKANLIFSGILWNVKNARRCLKERSIIKELPYRACL